MGIRISTKRLNTLQSKIEGNLRKWQIAKAQKLADAGEILVKIAISTRGYQDRTGDLTNSIGYAVFFDGKIFAEWFTSGKAGQIAREKAYEYGKKQGRITLVVVAGMNYASYVESQGFNVLASAEQISKTMIPKLLKQK